MAILSDEELEAIGAGDCEPDDRSFRLYIATMLSQIAASTAAAAGGGTPFAALHTQTTVDVLAASTAVLPAYAARKGGWVKNISGGDVWVSLSAAAVVGAPTFLPDGEIYNLPPLYTGVVTAIRQAGAGTHYVEAVDW